MSSVKHTLNRIVCLLNGVPILTKNALFLLAESRDLPALFICDLSPTRRLGDLALHDFRCNMRAVNNPEKAFLDTSRSEVQRLVNETFKELEDAGLVARLEKQDMDMIPGFPEAAHIRDAPYVFMITKKGILTLDHYADEISNIRENFGAKVLQYAQNFEIWVQKGQEEKSEVFQSLMKR